MDIFVWMGHFGCCRYVFGLFRKSFIVSHNGTAASAGYRLVTVKAVNSKLSKRASVFAFVKTSQRFGRIFDKDYMIMITYLGNLINTAGMAKGVHGHTCRNPITGSAVVTGMIFIRVLDLKKPSKAVGSSPNVSRSTSRNMGFAPTVRNGIGRCHKAQRLGNYLIIRLNTCQFQSNMQSACAVYRGYGIFCACNFAYHFLKTIDILAYRGNKGGIDTVNNILLFITDKPWRVQRDRALVGIERFDEFDNL